MQLCVCVFSSACSPLALQPRPGGSAVRLSQGNHAGFSSAELLLRGNILHFRWREDKQSKGWRRKPWDFNCFRRLLTSPGQQSICKTLKVVHLVHIVAASPRSVSTGSRDEKKRRFCVGHIGKTRSKTDPGTRPSIQENKGVSVPVFYIQSSYWKGIKHWLQLWKTQTVLKYQTAENTDCLNTDSKFGDFSQNHAS